MLEELKVLNGQLDLKFDKYNYTYTIEVANEVQNLEFIYQATPGYNVSVIDNKLDELINYIYINVYNDESTTTYTIIANKTENKATSLIEEYKSSLEVPKESVSFTSIAFICIGCFITILIIFILLFKKHDKSR